MRWATSVSCAARLASSPIKGPTASGRSASRASSTSEVSSTSGAGAMRREHLDRCRWSAGLGEEAGRGGRFDGRALGTALDEANRQLGLPQQAPGLAERAGAAAALLRTPPWEVEDPQAVEQPRAGQAERQAQVELERALGRFRLEPSPPLLHGEITGERHHRRGRRAPSRCRRRRRGGRGSGRAAPPALRRAPRAAASLTSASPGCGRPRRAASAVASRLAPMRWSRRHGRGRCPAGARPPWRTSGSRRRAGMGEDVRVPAGRHHPRAVAAGGRQPAVGPRHPRDRDLRPRHVAFVISPSSARSDAARSSPGATSTSAGTCHAPHTTAGRRAPSRSAARMPWRMAASRSASVRPGACGGAQRGHRLPDGGEHLERAAGAGVPRIIRAGVTRAGRMISVSDTDGPRRSRRGARRRRPTSPPDRRSRPSATARRWRRRAGCRRRPGRRRRARTSRPAGRSMQRSGTPRSRAQRTAHHSGLYAASG